MKNNDFYSTTRMLAGAALLCIGTSALADWSFASGTSVTDAGVKVGATGLSTSGSGSTFASASVTAYSGSGLGVAGTGDASGSPNHSTDNAGNTDALLLSFDKSVVLTGLTSGWNWKNDTLQRANGETQAAFQARQQLQASSGSEVSLLRYIGSLTDTAAITAAASGKAIAQLVGADGGWALVSQIADLVTGSKTTTGATQSQGSSWWLVSAYNSSYSSAAAPAGFTNGNDYFKLLSVAGNLTPTTSSRVPEPGSLGLFGAGLVGMLALGRRRQQRQADLG